MFVYALSMGTAALLGHLIGGLGAAVPVLDVIGDLLNQIQQWILANRLAAAVIGIACAGIFVMVSAQMGLRRALWVLGGIFLIVAALRIAQDIIAAMG